MTRTIRLAGVCTVLALGALAAPAARAQEIPAPAVELVAGWARYDLSGTGTTPFAAVRADLPMTTWLYAELSFATLRYTSQGGDRIRHLATEVQVQGSYPIGRFHPYLGAGAGGFFDLRKQRSGADFARPTLSGAGGVRVALPYGFGARVELRIRGIGSGGEATTDEWGVGVSHTF